MLVKTKIVKLTGKTADEINEIFKDNQNFEIIQISDNIMILDKTDGSLEYPKITAIALDKNDSEEELNRKIEEFENNNSINLSSAFKCTFFTDKFIIISYDVYVGQEISLLENINKDDIE